MIHNANRKNTPSSHLVTSVSIYSFVLRRLSFKKIDSEVLQSSLKFLVVCAATIVYITRNENSRYLAEYEKIARTSWREEFTV